MSGGTNEVQATFWLLDAPTSLVALSETQPDGVGLGTFNRDGTPWVYRKPVAANRSQTFIADAHEVSSRTFLAHIRHATAGEPTIENTHPFEQHGRLFAHNGVLGDLPALRERLGDHAALVQGSTDSELYFTLMTKRIEENGGDVAAGITQRGPRDRRRDHAVLAEHVADDADRRVGAPLPRHQRAVGSRALDRDARRTRRRLRFRSARGLGDHARVLRAARDPTRHVIASQPMDTNPLWRLLEPVSWSTSTRQLRVTSTIAVPDAPGEHAGANREAKRPPSRRNGAGRQRVTGALGGEARRQVGDERGNAGRCCQLLLPARLGRQNEHPHLVKLLRGIERDRVRAGRREDLVEQLRQRDHRGVHGVDQLSRRGVARRDEAILGQHLLRQDQLRRCEPLLELEAGERLHERHSAAVDASRGWASMIRTSTVPSRGCGRTSHHRNVGSGIAPDCNSRSTVATQSW